MAESNSFKHTLIVRALSGTALVAVMLTMLYLGGWWWHGFAAFIALGSLWEFCRMEFAKIVGGLVEKCWRRCLWLECRSCGLLGGRSFIPGCRHTHRFLDLLL